MIRNICFRRDIQVNKTRGDWKNSKFTENTPPCGRLVSTQFLVFPIPLVLI